MHIKQRAYIVKPRVTCHITSYKASVNAHLVLNLNSRASKQPAPGLVVKASDSQSVDLDSILWPSWTKRLLKVGIWKTGRQVCLLCPWARHLKGH